jgi:hypothetical protein
MRGAGSPFLGFGNPLLIGRDGADQRAFAKQNCGKYAPREVLTRMLLALTGLLRIRRTSNICRLAAARLQPYRGLFVTAAIIASTALICGASFV